MYIFYSWPIDTVRINFLSGKRIPEVKNNFTITSDLLLVQDKKYKNKLLLWLKKLGFWGFMFFLVKGLVWLAVMYWIAK